MSKKIDPQKAIHPNKIPDVSNRKQSSRPPMSWPGIPGRSAEHEAEFVHHGNREEPAEVTEQQRRLEREIHEENGKRHARRDPEE
jgi:hypothetical protein